MLALYDLKTEYRIDPIGIDSPKPRFSWKLRTDKSGVKQCTYRILVSSGTEAVWDSGVIKSEQSVAVVYDGRPLSATTDYQIAVYVTDNLGEEAQAAGSFRTGLLTPDHMRAEWITHGFEDDLEPPAVFEKSFAAGREIVSAFAYVSALGIYELRLNGEKVGNSFFAPGWTSYQKCIQYQTYDLKNLLAELNTLQITVGNGWYKGILGFHGQGDHYGHRTAVIAQIEITYSDGHTEYVLTGEGWRSTTGEVRYSDIYNGEIIDKTFSNDSSAPARLYHQSKDVLTAQQDELVRITQRVPAQKILHTPKGETVIDFGQNLAGVVEARLHYPAGTKVVIHHAEALDENGNFYTTNLRTAKATDTFICSGGDDVFLPSFTYHGFRYIQIEGLPDEPQLEDFTACVMHTDLEQTGQFSCTNELVNRLWQNIDWTMRSNYLEIPSDCPQRDERFGYTGDAQIFLATAACHRNVELFFEKWLNDLKIEQDKGFGVPTAVPNILGESAGGLTIWHDAATVVPWTLWQIYGDKRVLEEQFESMVSCVEYTKARTAADGLLHTGQELGDWVAMDAERGPLGKYWGDRLDLSPGEKTGATDVYFVANTYYLNSIKIVADTAEILEKYQEKEHYQALYEEVLQTIRDEYVTRTGRLISETQAGCALALHFGIAEEKDRGRMLEALKANLMRHDNHLTTGFVGTQFLCKVLSENGKHDLAGKVFLKEDCPSWLYSVRLGGTTVWELWDGVNEDGSFNKYEMNSLNQYAFASIGDWIFRDLGGLAPMEPGYKKSRIAPKLILGIPSLQCSIETAYGKLSCAISCLDGKYVADIEIPANTTAVVTLPEREPEELPSGCYHYEYPTESCYEKQPYDMETTFGQLLENPVAEGMLQQYAGELLNNELFMQFAKPQRLEAICGMLPPEIAPLFASILQQCNAQTKMARQ